MKHSYLTHFFKNKLRSLLPLLAGLMTIFELTTLTANVYADSQGSFEEFQSIPTQGAMDWEFFTIDNTPYLAVANHTSYHPGYTEVGTLQSS